MVILILLGALVGVGGLLYIHHRLTAKPEAEVEAETTQPAGTDETECCGMHLTCDKDSLVAGIDPETLYYDDEELDRYAGREPDAYLDDEKNEFREVMYTLRPDEIAPWARSITARGIKLPDEVRDELLMIVAEARQRLTLKPEQTNTSTYHA